MAQEEPAETCDQMLISQPPFTPRGNASGISWEPVFLNKPFGK